MWKFRNLFCKLVIYKTNKVLLETGRTFYRVFQSKPSSVHWPGPYDEVLRLRERGQVSEGRLDEAVGGVAQEVSEHPCVGGGGSFGGETHLGGVLGLVVGRVQVEVGDVPEPAWMKHFKSKEI